jgi:hypothetical protein
MASLIYNSFFDDVVRGNINPASDTFKVMLTTSAYTEDKDSHTKRSNVTNEVVGTGYSTGGSTITFTVTKDIVNDRIDISLGSVTWASSTITARKAVIYKSRGGASTADELVCVFDFGSDQISSNGNFTINAGGILRVQN